MKACGFFSATYGRNFSPATGARFAAERLKGEFGFGIGRERFSRRRVSRRIERKVRGHTRGARRRTIFSVIQTL